MEKLSCGIEMDGDPPESGGDPGSDSKKVCVCTYYSGPKQSENLAFSKMLHDLIRIEPCRII